MFKLHKNYLLPFFFKNMKKNKVKNKWRRFGVQILCWDLQGSRIRIIVRIQIKKKRINILFKAVVYVFPVINPN